MKCGVRSQRLLDHPRVSGEHTPTRTAVICGDGSSPRERGARNKTAENIGKLRIIPA